MFLGIVDFGKSTYSSPKSFLMCENKGLGDPTPTKNHVSVHIPGLSGCDEMSTEPSYGLIFSMIFEGLNTYCILLYFQVDKEA